MKIIPSFTILYFTAKLATLSPNTNVIVACELLDIYDILIGKGTGVVVTFKYSVICESKFVYNELFDI
jgi:hypothetical protein